MEAKSAAISVTVFVKAQSSITLNIVSRYFTESKIEVLILTGLSELLWLDADVLWC